MVMGCQAGRSAGMAHERGGGHVAMVGEECLERDGVRTVAADECGECGMDAPQPLTERLMSWGPDIPCRNDVQRIASDFENPIPRGVQPRINPKNNHVA